MEFNLVMDARPPDALISCTGELDVFTAVQLGERLQDAMEIGCLRVLVDLAGVTFVDASALGVLSKARTQFVDSEGSMRFVAWSPPFLRLCRMTGLDSSFQLIDR